MKSETVLQAATIIALVFLAFSLSAELEKTKHKLVIAQDEAAITMAALDSCMGAK